MSQAGPPHHRVRRTGRRTALRRLVRWRWLRLPITVLAVSFLTFLLLNLIPGDPAFAILGPFNVNPENLARVHRELGLDQPLPARYLDWLGNALHGDLGQSYRSGEPVATLIARRIPISLELMVLAQLLALVLAVLVASAQARKVGGLVDSVGSGVSMLFLSVPGFALAVGLVFLFAVRLKWLPATGFRPLADGLGANLRSMLLPSIALAAAPAAVYARVLRAELISTLDQDFVRFALAKGLPPRTVLFRHALRPSTLPLVTLAGINVGVLLGGVFIIEAIFALPGVGSLGVQAIYSKDYLVVQGVVLVVTVAYVLINFLVDLLYPVIDPGAAAR